MKKCVDGGGNNIGVTEMQSHREGQCQCCSNIHAALPDKRGLN